MTQEPGHREGGWHLNEGEHQEFRKEFAQDREVGPFRANHTFRNGTRLIGIENKNGVPEIMFIRNGEALVDMQDYLPEGFTLTRQTNPEKELAANRWYTNLETRQINVGDMSDPRALLSLLHEIGHVHTDWEEQQVATAVQHETTADESDASPEARRESAKKVMQMWAAEERGPWAYAVLKLREIAEKADFEVDELFASSDELRSFIHNHLETYRRVQAEKYRKLFSREEFLEFAEELWDAFHGKGVTEKKLNEDLGS